MSLGLLCIVLVLVCAGSPILNMWYSRSCSSLVTSIVDYIAMLDNMTKVNYKEYLIDGLKETLIYEYWLSTAVL